MNPIPANVSQKRKRPVQNLSEPERKVYDEILKMEDKPIWVSDIKKNITHLSDPQVKRHLQSLLTKNLIKEVPSIKYKKRKYYMAVEFEPSAEFTGGAWYANGELEKDYIEDLKKICTRIVYNDKVVSLESLSKAMKEKRYLTVECPIQQLAEIMRSLVLDNKIMEVTSTGMGEFEAFRFGTMCYTQVKKVAVSEVGAMASIPCGVCPRISECTPNGIISPKTCVYYNKWLDI